MQNSITRSLNIYLTTKAYNKLNKVMEAASIKWNNLKYKHKHNPNRKDFNKQLHDELINTYT